MRMNRPEISVVWLKRDLRLEDSESLYRAVTLGKRILILYVFENILLDDPHYSTRHWNFVKQSITEMNNSLKQMNTKVLCVQSDVVPVFNQLLARYNVTHVFSHQETGLNVTFERDKHFKRFAKNNNIHWEECINNGVQRAIQNREGWIELWEAYMKQDLFDFKPNPGQLVTDVEIKKIEELFLLPNLKTEENTSFQPGGFKFGKKYLSSFLNDRIKNYNFYISKPFHSRKSCSRLSPYIAWGNLSIRQVWQAAYELKSQGKYKRQLSAFMSRLRWQAHFIQKFEMECSMEFESVNKGYRKLKKEISALHQQAWEKGKTGFPLVDACMRCLKETGYLNFRMRALVVSFFTHLLWQPWQGATKYLSSMFLDFEPGIHFPQLQMQAGETGINTLRIYNPVKNAFDHDSKAEFIKKWVPELSSLPNNLAIEPYKMTKMEQVMYKVQVPEDYPSPIVDLNMVRSFATKQLWDMKKDEEVIAEGYRILQRHTLPNRKMQ